MHARSISRKSCRRPNSANRSAAREAGVSLDLEVAANLPLVRGDAAKLQQAFSNIVSNAIKFTLRDGA